MLSSKKIIANINQILLCEIKNKGIGFKIDDLSNKFNTTIHIEPIGYKNTSLDGMQIIFENGIYEVSQFMAGKNQNELHIYLETKSFLVALKNMLKGNKNRVSIKKYI